jgi:hypothetical protein
LAATLLVGLIAGVTGATYADGEWAEAVVTSHHTYNLQIADRFDGEGTVWHDTVSDDGVTPIELEPDNGYLIPGVLNDQGNPASTATTELFVRNNSTLATTLALNLLEPEGADDEAAEAETAACTLRDQLRFAIAIARYDAGTWTPVTPSEVSSAYTYAGLSDQKQPLSLVTAAPVESVHRITITAWLDDCSTQADTNSLQAAGVTLSARVTGEDTY